MTRNAVPRDGDTTATCGTALKRWYKGFFNNVDADAGNKSAITTLQRSTAYAVGDILYTGELHAKYFLKCTTAGTTGSTEPSFSGVVSGDTVTDGTAVFTVQTKISLEEQEAKFVDDLLTALQTTGSLPSGTAFGATTLLSKMISQMNSDDGVQYNLTNSSAWYVKLGAKYGGLIIQGGFVVFGSQTEIEVTYLISLNEINLGPVISNGGYFTENWSRTKFKITRRSTNYNSYVSWIVAGW